MEKTGKITLRKATLKDLDGIYNVEMRSFTMPWTREAFYNELVHNHFATYLVLVENEKVIGYCGVWVIVDEAHVTNLAVLPEYRGRKLGETLLKNVMAYAALNHAETLSLEVRVSNIVARSLYRKLGFREGGIRKGYYTDNYEDAIVMWVNL
ncbi:MULTISPECIES: ribosomal protein S18-alanine N-acetyltransferase [Heyndrickxia]|uniref:[Ribosomal protein bS18]-alanine N-acetyltransferase n=1 Tax=Heyndrickxia coagulans DSM 1 = ATCC 7050 TaxID=1121088 RepID=A0A8B4C0X0_HEYCO|nr:ribosomal protein S18-alanine N-acetyltransferase [Heyndrickxia coagulans]AJH77657.1 ribosomal-protein-alanine acetyltransferase [Heyndrickxia coagulans DSM 1 = ATCC 7050]MCR2847761.1 ribosomal protein S18-alanine N-acetyltransferase [Heyndrickxia coagulans]MDR4225491.1 ribosomal-protein-alanine N-acetyltransferase [Heyndrickxia coagulans DSM 1 = ATCC 7050]MEC5269265.1 ribosomal protein S18-alanine N-acetyltransferase [Heyndrickxia coagulans]MED4405116.1 ribosomal protein S18-alanine N-acet